MELPGDFPVDFQHLREHSPFSPFPWHPPADRVHGLPPSPGQGMGCREHHFHGCGFIPRVAAVSALCGLCPSGLVTLDGKCALGENFIPVLAQGQSWVSRAQILFGSAAEDRACRWLQAVGHLCRTSSVLACPRCQPRERHGTGPGQGTGSIPRAGSRPGTVGRPRRFP